MWPGPPSRTRRRIIIAAGLRTGRRQRTLLPEELAILPSLNLAPEEYLQAEKARGESQPRFYPHPQPSPIKGVRECFTGKGARKLRVKNLKSGGRQICQR